MKKNDDQAGRVPSTYLGYHRFRNDIMAKWFMVGRQLTYNRPQPAGNMEIYVQCIVANL